MVDPDSNRISRVPPYSGTASQSLHHFAYGAFTLFDRLSQNRSAIMKIYHSAACAHAALQPQLNWFGLFRFRSPLLSESLLISFPGLLRWFSSPSVASVPYFIQVSDDGIASVGLPHSAIQGSQDMCSSPWLIAAYHGLLRLAAPRHPPYTYIRLTILSFRLRILTVQSGRFKLFRFALPLRKAARTFGFPGLSVVTSFPVTRLHENVSFVYVSLPCSRFYKAFAS